MRKPVTENEITMAICFTTMSSWNFSYNRRREWTIYAARYRQCSICEAPANTPCVNMADKKLGKTPRINRQPHDQRVNWDRMLQGLKERGYYRPIFEQQVRKRVPE